MSSEEILKEIASEVSVCEKCRLCKGRNRSVPGEGNPQTSIMFIGEGPGFNEDQQGRPFVGKAGHLLEEALASINLKRSDVFITNVVKCRPPDNRDPNPDEIAACNEYLDRQIEALNPQAIVTLGRFSMAKFFTKGEKISVIHGRARREGERIYIAMFHPAAALRSPQTMEMFRSDFKKIPMIIAEAERRTREGKLAPVPAKPKEEPPEQLSLF
ncbi:MAG TPA: uracil-DNA glycosylase [Ktedonobacteraceae bacterium]|nr:uracil-DNA glycosylase [Ktedonobacteraceae bacterium]